MAYSSHIKKPIPEGKFAIVLQCFASPISHVAMHNMRFIDTVRSRHQTPCLYLLFTLVHSPSESIETIDYGSERHPVSDRSAASGYTGYSLACKAEVWGLEG
jgi:hypothetical protein